MNVVSNTNSVIMEGHLTRDAVIREPRPGFRITRFPIGTNKVYKKQDGQVKEESSFFDVDSFGELADYCKEYGKKGTAVRVIGRLKQERWKDKGGHTRTKVLIIAESVELKPHTNKKQTWAEILETHAEAKNYAMASRAAFEYENQEHVVF